jgi:small-conductance mechanosensitive channel
MAKSFLKSDLIQMLISLVIVAVLGFVLFQVSIEELITNSQALDLLFGVVFPAIFNISLLFLIFKIAHFAVINLCVMQIGGRFVDQQKLLRVLKIVNLVWWAVFILFALFLVVDDPTTLITSAGLVGLGLTVALQKPIMNFVGWAVIVFQRIYEEGDRIKIGSVRGDVKEIQLMNTVMYSLLEMSDQRSHKLITVPNELVLTTDVENYTKNSNYVLEELHISITYESNYHKASSLLEKLILQHITRNIKSYIKKRSAEQLRLDKVINKLVRGKDKKELTKEQEGIAEEIKQLEELRDEFKPKIRIEMADSAIIIIALFLTPYDAIKKTRTKINSAFLDAIATEKDIEVAYPHMQLVMDANTKKKVVSKS